MATPYGVPMPTFHNVFRNTDGTPLISGFARFSLDSDHDTRASIYEDRALTIELANPMKLNAAGISAKLNGAPKPIWLRSDTLYYVDLAAADDPLFTQPIQTVPDWNQAEPPDANIDEKSFTNYITNPQFRFPIKDKFIDDDLPDSTDTPILYEGWYFNKDTINSKNTIEFVEFDHGQTDVPDNPKYYLSFDSINSGAESIKDIKKRFEDVRCFNGKKMSFGAWLKGNASALPIQFIITQNFGSGGSPSVTTVIDTYTTPVGSIAWNQFNTEDFIFPSISGKTLGPGDGYVDVGFRLPLGISSVTGIANAQLNKGEILLDFNYVSVEEEHNRKKSFGLPDTNIFVGDDYNIFPYVEDIGSTTYSQEMVGHTYGYRFRSVTGKVEEWLNQSVNVPVGTLPMHGLSYKRLDTIPNTPVKYNRLYQAFESAFGNGNIFGFGSDGFIDLVTYGNSALLTNASNGAVATWSDNNTGFTVSTIQNSGTLGFNTSVVTPQSVEQYLEIQNNSVGVVSPITAGTSGFTVSVITTGTVSVKEKSKLEAIVATTLSGKYFEISSVGTDRYIWFKVNGVGTDPAVASRTGTLIELHSTQTAQQVQISIVYALNGHRSSKIVCAAATTLSGGEYLNVHNTVAQFTPYMIVDGVGDAPTQPNPIPVQLLSSDTNIIVSVKLSKAISGTFFTVPDIRGYFIRSPSGGSNRDPDSAYRTIEGTYVEGANSGSVQGDEFKAHIHGVHFGDNAGFNSTQIAGKNGPIAPEGTQDSLSTGGSETRAKNFYLNHVIRY